MLFSVCTMRCDAVRTSACFVFVPGIFTVIHSISIAAANCTVIPAFWVPRNFCINYSRYSAPWQPLRVKGRVRLVCWCWFLFCHPNLTLEKRLVFAIPSHTVEILSCHSCFDYRYRDNAWFFSFCFSFIRNRSKRYSLGCSTLPSCPPVWSLQRWPC